MSYLVCHMQKIKMFGVKGFQFHNQRERESRTNLDIDREKSHLNYDLHNEGKIDYNAKIKDIIAKNVITDRAIRKDAVVLSSFIVTSDPDFFDKISDLEQQRFFKESYKFLSERYGKENVVYARVHLDEKTPHMHIGVVPVTKDNRLSAKSIFTRKELLNLQDDFYKYITEKGFNLERGISTDKKHIETKELKAKTLDEEVKGLALKRDTLQNDLKAIREDLDKCSSITIAFDDINHLEGKKSFLNKSKITLDKEDFEYLKTIAKKQLVLENKFDSLKLENESLKTDVKDFKNYYEKNQRKKLD